MKSLEFAIKMEKDGEQYYLEQAKVHQGTGLEKVFLLLAQDEQEHARILQHHADQIEYALEDGLAYQAFRNVFSDLDEFKVEEKQLPDQLDAYEHALKFEEDAINLYHDMLAEAETETDKRLFQFLIEQEKLHKQVFQDIVEHLRKAKQWVESAEFGLQEDY